MIKPTTLLKFAAYSVSMPTLAVSPALAKATVYMPSHVAAELLRNDSQSAHRSVSHGRYEPVAPMTDRLID